MSRLLNYNSLFSGILLLFMLFACNSNAANFTTAEALINTYYENHNNKDILEQCFYPEGFDGATWEFWSSYEIISKSITKKVGKKTHSNVLISDKALEIVVEETTKKGDKIKFWYLVQKINDQWKIIEHSHIPNDQFPSYD